MPSARRSTVNSPAKGASPAMPDLPPSEKASVAPWPASCARLRGGRVDQQPEHRLGRVLAHQRREQPGGVAVAARARVVLGVGQHHRRARLATLARAPHRVVRRVQLEREVALRARHRLAQALDRGADFARVAAVAEHGHAALVEIGHRKARGEREHDVVAVLQLAQLAVKAAAGLDEGRLRRQPGQEVELARRRGEPRAGLEHALEQPRRARAGLGHVDVRVGAVGHQGVGALEHGARQVAVQIEARRDRHARPDQLAHPAQDLAFAVVVLFGHHRAVQVEVNAVHRQRGLQVLEQAAEDALEGVVGDLRRGAGRGPGGADQAVAFARAAPGSRPRPGCWRPRPRRTAPRRT